MASKNQTPPVAQTEQTTPEGNAPVADQAAKQTTPEVTKATEQPEPKKEAVKADDHFKVLNFERSKKPNAIGLKVRALIDFKWKSMIVRKGNVQRVEADLAADLKERGAVEILGTY